ncbi:MAG: hypothetical protein LQ340_004679 [Diploschistes diacapsis]|nr:MAG: hypothetical protein LQ340_004679 [Diploschistes diacapsis]
MGPGYEKNASLSQTLTSEKEAPDRAEFVPPVRQHAPGFAVDAPGIDDEDEDDDELALAALDSLDVIDIYKVDRGSEFKTQQAQIPVDNWRQLLLLLLVVAPLGAQEELSTLAERVTKPRLESLRRVANNILWAFAPEHNPGVDYRSFITIIDTSLPYLFEGLSPLFEHFLFSKNINLNRHRSTSFMGELSTPQLNTPAPIEPLLQSESEVLTLELLSQLSFFLKPTDLFRRVRLLYSGAEAGFSINSVSQKVINWQAPSILLISGTRLPRDLSSRQQAFCNTLPPKKLPPGTKGDNADNRVVFGAYLHVPWKQTHKEAIGDPQTILFQLEPVHEVFRASTLNRDYVTFSKAGVGIGVPPPKKTVTSLNSHTALGPVSLFLDENLEFGVFTHEVSGGGAFGTSRTRKADWQDRFEIDAVEIWGCGGDEEAERQREAWKWEEREAAARRGVNLGRDREADYALLEMAGLVNQGHSGGSMG